jgi:hypothetical protein
MLCILCDYLDEFIITVYTSRTISKKLSLIYWNSHGVYFLSNPILYFWRALLRIYCIPMFRRCGVSTRASTRSYQMMPCDSSHFKIHKTQYMHFFACLQMLRITQICYWSFSSNFIFKNILWRLLKTVNLLDAFLITTLMYVIWL